MKRLRRRRSYLPAQRRDRRPAPRMNRIRQNNNERVAPRIHPQRRPSKPSVPKAANRKHLTPRSRKCRINIPSKPSCSHTRRRLPIRRKNRRPANRARRLLRLRHQLQRSLLERKGTGVVEEFVEQSLGEEADVVSSRENSRMPSYSSHTAGARVVDGAAEEVVVVGVKVAAVLDSSSWAVGAMLGTHFCLSQLLGPHGSTMASPPACLPLRPDGLAHHSACFVHRKVASV